MLVPHHFLLKCIPLMLQLRQHHRITIVIIAYLLIPIQTLLPHDHLLQLSILLLLLLSLKLQSSHLMIQTIYLLPKTQNPLNKYIPTLLFSCNCFLLLFIFLANSPLSSFYFRYFVSNDKYFSGLVGLS